MTEPVEYKNKLGESRWQPRLDTGERMWYGPGWYGEHLFTWAEGPTEHCFMPDLMSRRRARKLAREERERRDRAQYREVYREVTAPPREPTSERCGGCRDLGPHQYNRGCEFRADRT